MNHQIEDYLRSRGARYFRGHHDDEYFFPVDAVVDGRHKRLQVHLQPEGGASTGSDIVQVSVTSDRYYPASARGRLAELAAWWQRGEPSAEVVIHDSSDPSLVGVSAYFREPVVGLPGAADHAVAAAIDLFALMRREVAPARGPVLRDAG